MFSRLIQCFAMVLVVTVTTVTAARPVAVMIPFAAPGAPATNMMAPGAPPVLAEMNRDKTGTNASAKKERGSLIAENKPKASRGSFEAEGRGLEPPTAYAAPDFESGCWPIRLPSRVEATQLNTNCARAARSGRALGFCA